MEVDDKKKNWMTPYKPIMKRDNYIIPNGRLLICKVLVFQQKQDSANSTFEIGIPPSELLRLKPFETEGYLEDTLFRTDKKDAKNKMWFIHDQHLLLPEYFVEFEYAQNLQRGTSIYQFGDILTYLEDAEAEFITPKNVESYAGMLNEIFDQLSENILKHKLNYQPSIHIDKINLQAHDLDQASLSFLKVKLINYFKLCISKPVLKSDILERVVVDR